MAVFTKNITVENEKEVFEGLVLQLGNSEFMKQKAHSLVRKKVATKIRTLTQSHMNSAINTIKAVYRHGVPGAESGIRSLSMVYNNAPAVLPLRTPWKKLSPVTLSQKRGGVGYERRRTVNRKTGEIRGGAKFHYDTGELWLAIRSLRSPALHVTTAALDQKKGKLSLGIEAKGAEGSIKLDYEIAVWFDQMEFPFDELVRRPLIAGNKLPVLDLQGAYGNPRDGYNLVAILERGRYSDPQMPPRPFLWHMSNQLSRMMTEAIYDLKL